MPRAEPVDVRARLIAVTLPNEEWFSPYRLSLVLGIDKDTVHRAVYRYELPPPVKRTKHRWVFLRSDLRQAQLDAVKP